MADAYNEIESRLTKVRRRWRNLGLIKAVSIGVVEAMGLVLLFMLADYVYQFSPLVRTVLLGVGAAAVIAVVLRHSLEPLRKRVRNTDLALLVEERNPELQGTLLSAAEFGGQASKGSALNSYIVGALVAEADRKIQFVDIRKTVDLNRLRKYGYAALVAMFLFVVIGAAFPNFLRQQGIRVLLPWSPEAERMLVGDGYNPQLREGFLTTNLQQPIKFRVHPGDEQNSIEILEGGSLEVVTELSRSPLGMDVEFFFRAPEGDWEKVPMSSIDKVYAFSTTLEDIVEPLEYYIAVGNDKSKVFNITVRQRLKVEWIQLTYNYPEYLRLNPRTIQTVTGDITAVQGTKVDLKIKTNQAIAKGHLEFENTGTTQLDLTPEGGTTSIDVTKDDTYRFFIENKYGEQVESEQIYFIKALEDKPPTMEVVGPNIDMTVHPLSEITFTIKASEDFAFDHISLKYDVLRDAGKKSESRKSYTKNFLPKSWSGKVEDQMTATVLSLDEFAPYLNSGDSIFYHLEAVDRKGQKSVSDMFYVSLAGLEGFMIYPQLEH